jgi:hypothetical protein
MVRCLHKKQILNVLQPNAAAGPSKGKQPERVIVCLFFRRNVTLSFESCQYIRSAAAAVSGQTQKRVRVLVFFFFSLYRTRENFEG